MEISYRAIHDVNTKVRRLAYLTTLLRVVGRRAPSAESLVRHFINWGREHQGFLHDYVDRTGDIVPKKNTTRKSYAAQRYIDFAVDAGLLARISNVYRVTRIGLVLLAVLKEEPEERQNPFCLDQREKIFFLHQLLHEDADTILTIVDFIRQHHDPSLQDVQRGFQLAYLERLGAKISASHEEHVRRQLLDRKNVIETTWRSPARYAEHIVPSRLNWLLDLGFLEPEGFSNQLYHLSSNGDRFVRRLPRLPNADLTDIPDEWFPRQFFHEVYPTLRTDDSLTSWETITEQKRYEVCQRHLAAAFDEFRHGSIPAVPKISLTQGLVYMAICLAVDDGILTDLRDLRDWFKIPRVMGSYAYQIRFSPRENEAYFIRMRT